MKKTFLTLLIGAVLNIACKTMNSEKKSKTIEAKGLEPKNMKVEKVIIDTIPCEVGLKISATKMNILYIGIDNPVDIQLSNYYSDVIDVRISGGTIRKVGKGYNVAVKKQGRVTISVYANGKYIGEQSFRSRYLQDPVVTIGKDKKNWRGGTMPKQQLKRMRINATLLQNLDMDLKFNIASHSIMGVINGKKVITKGTGSKFSESEKELISIVPAGRTVIIYDVKYSGPGGRLYNLGSLVYKLK